MYLVLDKRPHLWYNRRTPLENSDRIRGKRECVKLVISADPSPLSFAFSCGVTSTHSTWNVPVPLASDLRAKRLPLRPAHRRQRYGNIRKTAAATVRKLATDCDPNLSNMEKDHEVSRNGNVRPHPSAEGSRGTRPNVCPHLHREAEDDAAGH